MRPLAIDLFCGLGGWAEGLLAAGWQVIGFDIERHQYGAKKYPGELVLQDVLTLHGSQFRDASLIVASPPCTEYSYMAMPWTRAKQIRRALLGEGEFPEPYTGSRTIGDLNTLFDACFRIQREASEAAGRHVPLIVENVKGAQPWVGQSRYVYGSFHLWGDVPALMPKPGRLRKSKHTPLVETPKGTGSTSWFFGNSKHEGRHYGFKSEGLNWSDRTRHGQDFTRVAGKQLGTKQGGDWFSDPTSASRISSSKSPARKQASAEIAKIPFPLARWIAGVFA